MGATEPDRSTGSRRTGIGRRARRASCVPASKRADRPGEYPPGLEEDLDAHFRQVVGVTSRCVARCAEHLDALRDAVGVRGRAHQRPRRACGSGAVFHRLGRRGWFTGRPRACSLQVGEYAAEVQRTLEAIVRAARGARRRLGRAGGVAAARGAARRRRRAAACAERPASGSPRRDRPSGPRASRPSTADAERVPALVRERALRVGVPRQPRGISWPATAISRSGSSAAIPCSTSGSGAASCSSCSATLGVEARGVESDPLLVKHAVGPGARRRARRRQHLPADRRGRVARRARAHPGDRAPRRAQQLVDLVALAARKVRPGGRVIMETVNPQSLYVFARSFYLDPTHVRPVHPGYLEFLFREAGFAEVEIDWRNPPRDARRCSTRSRVTIPPTRQINANIDSLNALLLRAPGLRDHRNALMEIHQVVVAAAPGDAVTNPAFEYQRLLRRVGRSEIYAAHRHPSLARRRALAPRLRAALAAAPRATCSIVHLSIGDAAVQPVPRRASRASRARVPQRDAAGVLRVRTTRRSRACSATGASEVARLAGRADVAIGVSEYNAAELEALGYREVRVVPLVVDPAGFRAVVPDPATARRARGARRVRRSSTSARCSRTSDRTSCSRRTTSSSPSWSPRPTSSSSATRAIAAFARAFRAQLRASCGSRASGSSAGRTPAELAACFEARHRVRDRERARGCLRPAARGHGVRPAGGRARLRRDRRDDGRRRRPAARRQRPGSCIAEALAEVVGVAGAP